MKEMKTGGQIIWESLMAEGVEVVFGLPGGAILPAYDDLAKYEYPIHHVLVTHEQGASHMADGYARATGRVGVCIATSGPGATNLITGLGTAYMDSTPIVAITGQVPTSLLGRDGFQEADVQGVSLPVTKHNYLITDIRELPNAIKEAFYIARTGRPGPVLVDVCKDVQQASMMFEYPETVNLPGYNPNINAPNPASVARAAKLLNEATQPVIVAGQGVSIARAEKELKQLAEKANIPVATSLLGIGAFPGTHPLSISWGGMHGEAYCNYALQECDVMFAIGARLDDRLTGAFSTFAPKAKIIHVDLDPAEMGKNITIDTPVIGTMGYALPAAIGAQFGVPDEEIWVIAGDGGFQMTMSELSTVMQEGLPIKIAIINNGFLGMVRQWQDVFYNKRHSGTPLFNPDFVKLAEAYGITARAVTRKEDAMDAIKEAQAHDGPYLLDFQVEEFTNVYPMVTPGKSNADMIRRPATATEGEE